MYDITSSEPRCAGNETVQPLFMLQNKLLLLLQVDKPFLCCCIQVQLPASQAGFANAPQWQARAANLSTHLVFKTSYSQEISNWPKCL